MNHAVWIGETWERPLPLHILSQDKSDQSKQLYQTNYQTIPAKFPPVIRAKPQIPSLWRARVQLFPLICHLSPVLSVVNLILFVFQIQIFLFFSFIELRARYVKIDQSVKVEHSTKRVPALNIIDSCNEGHKINFAWHHMWCETITLCVTCVVCV